MSDDIAWLHDHQFHHYGSWTPEGGKLQRGELGRGIPGHYAFVVDGAIRYVGKAEKHLRGRVRNYNRSLVANPDRPHRKAHEGIKSTLANGKIVEAYIRSAGPDENVADLETMWICELRPIWNGT